MRHRSARRDVRWRARRRARPRARPARRARRRDDDARRRRAARGRARARDANDDEDEDEDFARWLARATKDDGVATRIALTERGRAFGTRGVEAVRDLAPGETLLRVPWGLVVESASERAATTTATTTRGGRPRWR